jgi:hypothetical protein
MNPGFPSPAIEAQARGKAMISLSKKSVLLGFSIALLVLVSCNRTTSLSEVSMTIGAIGPTGDTIYPAHPQPIWAFAITNTGSSNVEWRAFIEVRGLTDTNYSYIGGHIDWPEGVLGPGRGLQTNMLVPAKCGGWRAYIDYCSTPIPVGRERQIYNDVWH